ncbi:hypothetical protein WJX75_007332 [Coccomyxa subellipsoidea]|uniref:Uncharacterized protein n=1 Tax=Coccomyxa subellipsoidea TaxID=248742 RepID=A0ABR2YUF3_9CHLO
MREKKLCTAYGNFACKGDYWDEGEEGGAEDARGEATEAINMTSAYDKLLKEDTPGVRYRRVRSLVKIVRVGISSPLPPASAMASSSPTCGYGL